MYASISQAFCEPIFVAIFGLITALIGGVVGHRLTYWRDRRKERNDAKQVVRLALLKHRSNPSPNDVWPTPGDFDLLERLLPFWSRSGLREAINAYSDSKRKAEKRNEIGEVLYSNTATIKASLERLIAYTHWR